MEKSKLNSFLKRALSTIILAPIVIACIFLSPQTVYLLALVAATLLSWEWAHMYKGKSEMFFALSYLLCTTVVALFPSICYGFGVIVILSIIAYIRFKNENNFFLRMLGIPYISIGIGSIVALYSSYGAGILLWYMCLVWAVDIGGYLFGTTIKGPKLAPKISPNKTWAGLLGGMLSAIGISLITCYYFSDANYLTNFVIIAALVTIIAQTGDLIESAMKRHLGIKDSSNLIPGHGGIFDRIDGLIFAAPFTYGLLKVLTIVLN